MAINTGDILVYDGAKWVNSSSGGTLPGVAAGAHLGPAAPSA
jgi:hypothetical protein